MRLKTNLDITFLYAKYSCFKCRVCKFCDKKIYEKGYSGLDIIQLLENHKFLESTITIEKRYELLLAFNKVRKEFRNEKMLILFILNFIFLSSEHSLENISFM